MIRRLSGPDLKAWPGLYLRVPARDVRRRCGRQSKHMPAVHTHAERDVAVRETVARDVTRAAELIVGDHDCAVELRAGGGEDVRIALIRRQPDQMHCHLVL